MAPLHNAAGLNETQSERYFNDFFLSPAVFVDVVLVGGCLHFVIVVFRQAANFR